MPGRESESRYGAEDREHMMRSFATFIDSPDLCPGSAYLSSLTNGDLIRVELVRCNPRPLIPAWSEADQARWTADLEPETWRDRPPLL